MYKITNVDIKNNKITVMDTVTGIPSVMTRGEVLDAQDMGFNILGVLENGQMVVFDTWFNLRKLSSDAVECRCICRDVENRVCDSLETNGKVMLYGTFEGNADHLFGNIIGNIDITYFDISKVKNMRYMFSYFTGEIKGMKKMNTSSATDMRGMFKGANSVVDISSFNLGKIHFINTMFQGFSGKILGTEAVNVGNITNFGGMFQKCNVPLLDLSTWENRKKAGYRVMFSSCKIGTLRLGKLCKPVCITDMFKECSIDILDMRGTRIFSDVDLVDVISIFSMGKVGKLVYDDSCFSCDIERAFRGSSYIGSFEKSI